MWQDSYHSNFIFTDHDTDCARLRSDFEASLAGNYPVQKLSNGKVGNGPPKVFRPYGAGTPSREMETHIVDTMKRFVSSFLTKNSMNFNASSYVFVDA
jgi:hypothetical protein